MNPGLVAPLAVALVLAACGTTSPPAWRPTSQPALRRLVLPRAEPDFQVGDQARFELCLEVPGEPDRKFELEFLYLAETSARTVVTHRKDGAERRYEYPSGLVSLEFLDPLHPQDRHQQNLLVPLPPLREGLTPACALGPRLGPLSAVPIDAPEMEPLRAAVVSFVTFFQALMGVKPLESVMRDLATFPLLLLPTLVFGVTVNISPQFDRATPAPSPLPAPWDGPCWRLPWQLHLNGHLALEGTLLLADSRPPLSVVAGLLAVEAWQPGAPERRLSARLVELSAPGAPQVTLPGTRTGTPPPADPGRR